MNWINLAEDSDKWQAFMKIGKNLWVPYNLGEFFAHLVSS
jgi:hypothetical protein